MSSLALKNWFGVRANALNEIEAAHRGVGGFGRGRRYATEQINHAYAVLLSSQFQGYCRDLHTECTDLILNHERSVGLYAILRPALTQSRKLDKGNPNPGNIGADFNRFGVEFWDAVNSASGNKPLWKIGIEQLNHWRNAIAHQDFNPDVLGDNSLRLAQVRAWRTACSRLARRFDFVMNRQLFILLGNCPW